VSEELIERLRHEIAGWEQAYPLSAFPEPDLERAAAVLKDAGMTLDAISASNMRHVVSCLAPLIHEATAALEASGIVQVREALEFIATGEPGQAACVREARQALASLEGAG
jgi:hypothetical protein